MPAEPNVDSTWATSAFKVFWLDVSFCTSTSKAIDSGHLVLSRGTSDFVDFLTGHVILYVHIELGQNHSINGQVTVFCCCSWDILVVRLVLTWYFRFRWLLDGTCHSEPSHQISLWRFVCLVRTASAAILFYFCLKVFLSLKSYSTPQYQILNISYEIGR